MDTAIFNFKLHPDCTGPELLSLEKVKAKLWLKIEKFPINNPRSDFFPPSFELSSMVKNPSGFSFPSLPSSGKVLRWGRIVSGCFLTIEIG